MKMCHKQRFLLAALIAGCMTLPTNQVTAQTFTTLHGFTDSDGSNPQAGVIKSENTLYGVADYGGSFGNGTVFKVSTNGTGFTTLHDFTPTDGSLSINSDGVSPDGTLALSGSTLYGTAYYGGDSGNGTVFKLNTDGTGFTTLHSFTATSGSLSTNSDGANPESGVIVAGNTVFGTTENGGSAGYGVVFKISTNGTGFTTLHSFTGGSDGEVPSGLVLSGSTLYGVAIGFYSGNGTVFKLNTNGTGYTILHSFTAVNFSPPDGGPSPEPYYTNSGGILPTCLILSGDTLFGTTYWGGSNGNGIVFAVNTNGTGFTNLHSFTASYTNSGGAYTNSEGTHPIQFAGLVVSGNTLYGTANYGGASGNGTVFEINTDGTDFSVRYTFTEMDAPDFTNDDGANPNAGLFLSDNTLFGTATAGGSSGSGTVFSLTLPLPRLNISRFGANVVLTWPTVNSSGFTLQSTTNLVPPSIWSAVSPSPVVMNGQNIVTNPVAGAKMFYRLIQ